jgi:hypothetical protein
VINSNKLLTKYIRQIIDEIVNDRAMGRGFGSLVVDRDDPRDTYQDSSPLEVETDDEDSPINAADTSTGQITARWRNG